MFSKNKRKLSFFIKNGALKGVDLIGCKGEHDYKL